MKRFKTFAPALVAVLLLVTESSGSERKPLPPNMKWGPLILTSDDVIPGSVKVVGPDGGTDVAFAFSKKTPEEIETVMQENLGKKVAIKSGDKIVAGGGAAGGWGGDTSHQDHRCVGLVLIFDTKEEARKVARVLRGEKVE